MLITDSVIRTLEVSEALILEESARAARRETLRVAGGVAAFCGAGDVLTQTLGVGLEPMTSEDWRQLDRLYRGRTEVFEYKLSPLAHPETRQLVAKAAVDVPEFETILVHSLNSILDVESEWAIDRLRPDEVGAYVRRSMHWFFGDSPPPGFEKTIGASISAGGRTTYVVRDGGEIVAGAGLSIGNDFGWLNGGAVDPRYRGRGIHRALIAHRLSKCREQGLSAAAQGALPGSISQVNAQRQGFQIAFSRPTLLVRTASLFS